MVVLLISFFLRPKESLHPVCQLQVTGHIAAVNPSEALRLPPYSFKFRYKLPRPFLSVPGRLNGSKHRECGRTPIKSPFSACCRSGDFSCWEYPKPSLDCFANNTLKLDVSTRYLQKIVERFQVAWYDKDAMKQKEVVSNDKTQRSTAPCKASGLRRLHGVKIVA